MAKGISCVRVIEVLSGKSPLNYSLAKVVVSLTYAYGVYDGEFSASAYIILGVFPKFRTLFDYCVFVTQVQAPSVTVTVVGTKKVLLRLKIIG